MARHKRVKLYQVPIADVVDQVRHVSFTLSSEKTSVRNSFVALSRPNPPTPDIDDKLVQDPLDHGLHNDDQCYGSDSSQPQVSLDDLSSFIAHRKKGPRVSLVDERA